MKKIVVLLIAVALVCSLASVASASYDTPKSEGIAMLLSGLLLPGSGQFYAGSTGRGTAVLGGEIAMMVWASSESAKDSPSVLPFVGLLGAHIWQTIDAGKCASKFNETNGLAATGFADRQIAIPDHATTFHIDLVKRGASVNHTIRF